MEKNKRLVSGVGVNDSERSIIGCDYYKRWASMIDRCYGKLKAKYNPTYQEANICDDWLFFSNFKAWMEVQDWRGKHLDKDILYISNKIYQPDKCLFVEPIVNTFINDSARGLSGLPVGVKMQKGRFRSVCGNPLLKKQEHLGYFSCPTEAHIAWRKRKHELACQLADLQTDKRVAEALRARYA